MEVTVKDYITSTETSNNKAYVAYIVNCKHNGVEWEVQKRYSEFLALHNQLCKYFSAKQLPKFPPKLLFGNMKKENIVKRKLALHMYINEILSNDTLYDYDDVHQFLETKKHIKERIRKSQAAVKNSLQEVKATFDYTKQDESELEFKKGDLIVVLQKDTSGWWYGYVKVKPDQCGFFPNTFVDYKAITAATPAAASASTAAPAAAVTPAATTTAPASTASTTTSTTAAAGSNIGKVAKVAYEYTADGKDELTVAVGELVEILHAREGWCFVKKKAGSGEGYVPEDYLQIE